MVNGRGVAWYSRQLAERVADFRSGRAGHQGSFIVQPNGCAHQTDKITRLARSAEENRYGIRSYDEQQPSQQFLFVLPQRQDDLVEEPNIVS